MRCYYFNLNFFKPVCAGAQSTHGASELFVKYKNDADKLKYLYDWAEDHKTVTLLDCGVYRDLKNIEEYLDSDENPYPWSSFYESEDYANGLLTNAAIVVPDEIVEFSRMLRMRQVEVIEDEQLGGKVLFRHSEGESKVSWWEYGLITTISKCKLVS